MKCTRKIIKLLKYSQNLYFDNCIDYSDVYINIKCRHQSRKYTRHVIDYTKIFLYYVKKKCILSPNKKIDSLHET